MVLQLLAILFLLIEMLPANTMYIIDEDCAATSMTSGGDVDRRIAYMKWGYFFHRDLLLFAFVHAGCAHAHTSPLIEPRTSLDAGTCALHGGFGSPYSRGMGGIPAQTRAWQ